MKKKLTLTIVALMVMTTSVWAFDRSIDGYFRDAVFAKFVKANYDTNHDEMLSDAEANAVTRMEIDGSDLVEKYGKAIKEFDGIEYFPNLTELQLWFFSSDIEMLKLNSNSKLKTLGISYCQKVKTAYVNEGLEKIILDNSAITKLPERWPNSLYDQTELPNVKSFTCSGCPNIEKLTIKMPKLEELTCFNCEKLTKLDLANCPYLKTLECQHCAIKTLNVRHLDKLETLLASGNGMTGIEFDNDMLKMIDVSNNNLTSLILLMDGLEKLYCDNNQLTNLEFISGLDFSKLKDVYCSGNNIGEAAMYNLVNTLPTREQSDGYLFVHSSRFTNYNYFNTDQVAIAKAKGWTVYAEEEIPGGYDFIPYTGKTTTILPLTAFFFPDTKFLNYLKTLDTDSDNLLTISQVTTINAASKGIANLTGVEHFTALTTLHCENNSLTKLDLSKNTKLQKLYCSGNKLKSLDMTNNTALSYLGCYLNQIEGTQMDALITSLCDNTTKPNGYKTFYVYSSSALNDGNYCTQEQAARAKAKGWLPMCHESATSTTPVEFTGVDLTNYIAIDETNFPDANFRSYVKSNIDKGSIPDYLTPEEIAAVTIMDVSSKNITSLKGVEFFTALIGLNAAYNRLTGLDVTKNTALVTLHINQCHIDTDIDLTHNTLLKTLSIGSNNISRIDYSKCTELESFDCDGSIISTLDMSPFEKLRILRCENATISSLLVSPNAPLERVWMCTNDLGMNAMEAFIQSLPDFNGQKDHAIVIYNTEIGWEHNICTFLQVDELKAKGWSVHSRGKSTVVFDIYNGCGIPIVEEVFPDENFRGWLKAQNYGSDSELSRTEISTLKKLDVNGTGISSLEGIKYFTALEELFCFDNPISELDVSNNLNLRELYTYGTPIDVKAMSALIASMNDTKGVTKNFRVYKPGSGDLPCTPPQVAEAKAKGWNVLYYSNYKWQDITDYMGTTGIGREQMAKDNPNEVYDLSGRKVNAQKKGLYIVNGKKLLLDASGR